LDISNTNIGEVNWESVNKMDGTGNFHWKHTDGRTQERKPAEGEVKPEGIIAIANAISDMGAMLSVNLLQNRIGVDQAKALASILKEHPTLKSLCGNSGER
jgi:hypothetical protein